MKIFCCHYIVLEPKMSIPDSHSPLTITSTEICETLNPTWYQVITSLPTQHGSEVKLSCPEDYTFSGTDTAACEDGEFIVDGETPVCLG